MASHIAKHVRSTTTSEKSPMTPNIGTVLLRTWCIGRSTKSTWWKKGERDTAVPVSRSATATVQK